VVLVLKDVRKFSVFPVAAIDDPVLPEVLAELAAARADEIGRPRARRG
jgi:integrase/recombinase XerD